MTGRLKKVKQPDAGRVLADPLLYAPARYAM
jgi:hypothetical protein